MEVKTTGYDARTIERQAFAARECHTIVERFHSEKLADMQLKTMGILADAFAGGKKEGNMTDEDATLYETLEAMMCKMLELCYHPGKAVMMEKLRSAEAEFKSIGAEFVKAKKRTPSAE